MAMHPDTLLAYVAFGSGCRTARDCKMTSIDSTGLTMAYTDGGAAKTTRLRFDPPLRGSEEVRRRLVALYICCLLSQLTSQERGGRAGDGHDSATDDRHFRHAVGLSARSAGAADVPAILCDVVRRRGHSVASRRVALGVRRLGIDDCRAYLRGVLHPRALPSTQDERSTCRASML